MTVPEPEPNPVIEFEFAPGCVWPVNVSCCPTWFDADEALQDMALHLAVSTLQALTLGRVGTCPINARPCQRSCWDEWAYLRSTSWSGVYSPLLLGGCGCASECSCGKLQEVLLPRPVGKVHEVLVGTEVLLEGVHWRLDNGNRLVRIDGGAWPQCQDMTADPGSENSFVIRYSTGVAVDAAGAFAAGALACEFLNACSGKKCSLPSTVRQVTRANITYEIPAESWPNGRTGNKIVDAWINLYNPTGSKYVTQVFSPDLPKVRTHS